MSSGILFAQMNQNSDPFGEGLAIFLSTVRTTRNGSVYHRNFSTSFLHHLLHSLRSTLFIPPNLRGQVPKLTRKNECSARKKNYFFCVSLHQHFFKHSYSS